MDQLKWEFAPTGGGDSTGSNDPVTSVFKGGGDIYYHLARESIQNIIDARDPKTSQPAIAKITSFELQPSNFPSSDLLLHVFNECKVASNTEDELNFYLNAIDILTRNIFFPVLKISDYNTTGLTGDDEDETAPYYSLMKAVGSSSKSGSSGGSYGLGKGAYFIASSFKSIFISSRLENGSVVFQGKARIRSFKQNGKRMQGNGCCGLEGQLPVRVEKLIPNFFRRDETGTDIYILGYEGQENWKSQMIKSILNNFWFALSEGILEVEIAGTNINSDSIESLLEKNFDKNETDKTYEANPWPYYLAYKNGKQFSQKLPVLGDVKLYLLDKENFPNKIAYLRKIGMVIQKRGVTAPLTYAGVFVCSDERGNEILKKMENPSHDEWKLENAKRSEYEAEAMAAEKEMRYFIKSSVKKTFSLEGSQSLNVGGLEEFLWVEGDLGVGGLFGSKLDTKSTQTETGSEIGREMKLENRKPVTKRLEVIKEIKKGEHGGKGHVLDVGTGGNLGGGHEDELGTKKVLVMKYITYRSFAGRNDIGGIEHNLIISGAPGDLLNLEILAGTDDYFGDVQIKKAFDENGDLKNSENMIYGVKLNSSGKKKFKVFFNDNERYSLNVTAYATK